ncbi:MAG: RagB/SusD family nutrient uptake outer membrane protein, partial [Bacteroidales bacterium]
MKYRYLILSIIVTAFILQGCSDDFLDTPPRAAESEFSFYTNIDNLEAATIGCYSALEAQGNYDLGLMMVLGSIAGDDMEAGGRDASEIPDIQECDRMTHQPDNPRVRKVWGHTYRGIYHCNVYLKYFPDLLAEGDFTPEEQNLLRTRIGEVKFLRALYYFWLTQAFGGVVLMDAPPAPSELQSATRATIKEVYTLIESDLNEAISYLPERNQVSEVGRVTRGAAQALLGKVLLYESSYAKYKLGSSSDVDNRYEGCTQRWGEALALFEAVINSPQYSLLGLDGQTFSTFWTNDEPTTDAYRYIFSVGGDNQSGSVFEIQDIVDLGAPWIQAR